MGRKPFIPKAYLKVDCPFSFKYLLFMAEAGLLDRIEVIRCDPKSAEIRTAQDQAGCCDQRAGDISDRRGRTGPLSVRLRSVDQVLRAKEQRCLD